jgi:hypothetical protein
MKTQSSQLLVILSLAVGVAACSDDSEQPQPEAGARDAALEASVDLGTGTDGAGDLARADVGAPDASTPDQALPDLAPPDRALPDRALPDLPPPDLYIGDGGPTYTAPVSWDFESSCQGLAATGDWECGQINFSKGTNCGTYTPTPPTAGASGTGKGMWGTKLNDCYSPKGNNSGSSSSSCSNSNPNDDSILSVRVSIPSTWSTATLTYYSWDDVNGYFDWMEIRIDGSSVKRFCNPSTKPTSWVKNTVDLSSYTGKTITIGFHFLASTVVQYAGWYIDDLSISGS